MKIIILIILSPFALISAIISIAIIYAVIKEILKLILDTANTVTSNINKKE